MSKSAEVSVSRRVCIELQKAIFRGDYPPGSRLPAERRLAGAYHVSRSAAREAIANLAQLGLVKTLPQSGTYVVDFQAEASLDLLIHVMQTTEAIDSDLLISLLKYRRNSEPFTAREAALHAGDDGIAGLAAAGDGLIACLRDPASSVAVISEGDFNFHYLLTKLSGNLVYQLLFTSAKPIYRFYTDFYYTIPGTRAATIEFVQALVAAIAQRQAEKAGDIMDQAVLEAEQRLVAALDLEGGRKSISLKPR